MRALFLGGPAPAIPREAPLRPSAKALRLCLLTLPLGLFSCRSLSPGSAAAGEGRLQLRRSQGMDYGWWEPRGAARGARLPLLVYLHGYTEKPLAQLPWQVAALQRLEPCYVFIPSCPEAQGSSAWGGTYDAELRPAMQTALAILEGLASGHTVDRRRIYVYGGSMGGEGVFALLARRPGLFAGAVSVAGYTLDREAAAMARTPLWILHGSVDTVNATESSRKIYAAIRAAGGEKLRYTEYPGADHGTIWALAEAEPGLLKWLLEQRLP